MFYGILSANKCTTSRAPFASDSHDQSPRQSRKAENAVRVVEVEVRGSALHSNLQRQHSPLASRRYDKRNPSRFASSLEMFKRRLKMNQNR